MTDEANYPYRSAIRKFKSLYGAQCDPMNAAVYALEVGGSEALDFLHDWFEGSFWSAYTTWLQAVGAAPDDAPMLPGLEVSSADPGTIIVDEASDISAELWASVAPLVTAPAEAPPETPAEKLYRSCVEMLTKLQVVDVAINPWDTFEQREGARRLVERIRRSFAPDALNIFHTSKGVRIENRHG